MSEAIPRPPADPALPTLGWALSPDAMREVLGGHVSEGFELRSCRPFYIRYKPGTNCLVQYRLGLEERGSGRTFERLLQAKLHAPGLARRRWAKGKLQKLAENAATWETEVPLERTGHLEELGALFCLYPVDPRLPALAFAASSFGRRRVLRQVLSPAEAEEGNGELIRYKAGRKALLRYHWGGNGVYAKLYAVDRGRRVICAGRALEAAGVATPPALGHLSSLQMVVQAEAAGTPLRELRGQPSYAAGARAAGEILARLQGSSLPNLLPHTWADESVALAASASTVGVLRPDLAAAAARLAEQVSGCLAELELEPVTAHGDFYDDQLLYDDGEVVLLDLDEIRAAHPLLDVGNFLARVSAREGGEDARTSFLDGYAAQRALPEESLALFEAAALLRLTAEPFRSLQRDWPEGVERLLRLASERFAEYRRPASAVERPHDPALPQLEILCDRDRIAPELAQALGEPVEVRELQVIRHRPGRRCTLRYELTVGSRSETIYGKTFASERAPRVYRALEAIFRARAGGPEARVPAPVGLIPSLKLVLQREVPGVPLRQALHGEDERLAGRIAEALHALHGSEVELERRHAFARELEILRRRAEELAAACPRLAPAARRCFGLVQDAAVEPVAWRWQPTHRDFYHEQVLVNGRELAFLDLDDAAMSEPAVDVANFVAHLRLLALEEPERAEALDAFAAAFLSRYRELDSRLDARLVRLLEGMTLLRLAAIHLPRAESLAEGLLEKSEKLLRRSSRSALGAIRARRPRLRLELALDGEAVLPLIADAVESWHGARPSSCEPSLIAAEDGHAVVRYELGNGHRPLTLIGKWYADGRSAFVADVLSKLRERGFANGSFAVPAPVLTLPAVGALFMECAEGPSLRDVLEQDQAVARRAGAWLARFHSCDLDLHRARGPREHAEQVSAWGKLDPLLRPLSTKLAPELAALPNPAAPLHDDLKLTDVLVPEDGPTTVLDFDDAGAGDPALDLASFEAVLRLRGVYRSDADAFATAKESFRAGYEEQRPFPQRSPAVDAFAWLRLARKCLRRRGPQQAWRFAMLQAERSLRGEEAL